MKKAFSKSLSWLLSVVMIFGMAFMPASYSLGMGNISVNATDILTYGDFQYIVNDDNTTVSIKKYTGSSANVSIPSEIYGKPVSLIYDNAFWDCKTLYSVTIPDSVIGILNAAFYNFVNLKQITIPKSVIAIYPFAVGYEFGPEGMIKYSVFR